MVRRDIPVLKSLKTQINENKNKNTRRLTQGFRNLWHTMLTTNGVLDRKTTALPNCVIQKRVIEFINYITSWWLWLLESDPKAADVCPLQSLVSVSLCPAPWLFVHLPAPSQVIQTSKLRLRLLQELAYVSFLCSRTLPSLTDRTFQRLLGVIVEMWGLQKIYPRPNISTCEYHFILYGKRANWHLTTGRHRKNFL